MPGGAARGSDLRIGARRRTIERQYAAFEILVKHGFDLGRKSVTSPPRRHNGNAIAEFRFTDRREKQFLCRVIRNPGFNGMIG